MSEAGAPASPADYADWKAPTGDGEVLIWPDPSLIVGHARENNARLDRAEATRVLGIPLNELRREARRWIGHTEDDRPLIATGHQTELHHPGVWVKNAVIGAIAGKTGGAAYHVAVDTDSPKHLHLRFPKKGTSLFSEPITDDARASSAAWTGLLDAPSPAHLDQLDREVREAASHGGWGFDPAVGEVLASLRRLSLGTPRLSDALCNALHELDWSLGLRHHAMTASPILSSPPYLAFVASILADARAFAGRYNAALAGYRSAHGMTTSSRPMPDLFVSPTAIEMPFWLDDLGAGGRTRPSAFDRGDGRFTLKLASGEEIAFAAGEDGRSAATRLARFLAGTAHRLSPRALTLTMFLRLFVADQFVHGIGGGRYDQVLDLLIADHFKLAAPKFAVATATLLFPTAVGRSRACLPCVAHEGHQLAHRALGAARKRELVEQIAGQPRRSPQRYRAFAEMRSALRDAWAKSPASADWQRRLEQTREQSQRDAIEFDRELFYALQPRERLAMMVGRVGEAFS